jgi:hypothetical protein
MVEVTVIDEIVGQDVADWLAWTMQASFTIDDIFRILPRWKSDVIQLRVEHMFDTIGTINSCHDPF